MPVVVKGFRELNRAFAAAEKESRLGVRALERQVAEPVKATASVLAGSEIRNMYRSPSWAGMRVGVTRTVVYVAPKRKGVRGHGPRARPNLAGLLMGRAMRPALEQHRTRIERSVEELFDQIADRFNRPGPV